jgi:uncharacterized membrane protein YbhN (UPF0104 family)
MVLGPLAGAGLVLRAFDLHTVWRTWERADLSLLILAVALGVVVQVLRAQRAAFLLRREHQITLEQCFGAQVLSHAVQNIIPLGPGGYGLQGALTRRLANIPIPFSVGVFVACGFLDNVSTLPLICAVLWTMHLPAWIRLILLCALVRSSLVLLVPMIAALMRHRLHAISPRTVWGKKMLGAIADIDDGLATVVAGGWRSILPALALSGLITGGSMLRLSLLASAVELATSPHQVALLLVMGGLMKSVPVAVPGADAWATSRLARLVHVVGAGAAGFVILSSLLASLESPLLAAGVLLWWALPLSRVRLRFGEVVSLARHPAVEPPRVSDAA